MSTVKFTTPVRSNQASVEQQYQHNRQLERDCIAWNCIEASVTYSFRAQKLEPEVKAIEAARFTTATLRALRMYGPAFVATYQTPLRWERHVRVPVAAHREAFAPLPQLTREFAAQLPDWQEQARMAEVAK